MPELIPQPHGGALKRGGPNPGSGRPRSSVKAIAKKSLRKRITLLNAFADGLAVSLVPDPTDDTKQKFVTHAVPVSERIKAIAVLEKIAGDKEVAVSDIKARLSAQVTLIRSRTQWTTDELLDALDEVWR